MLYKIFTALPDFLSSEAKEVLFESHINDQTALIAWPRVIKYEYYNDFREKILSPNPPKADEIGYTIKIFNTEAAAYLTSTGWIYDPKHTGRVPKPIIDNRKTS